MEELLGDVLTPSNASSQSANAVADVNGAVNGKIYHPKQEVIHWCEKSAAVGSTVKH